MATVMNGHMLLRIILLVHVFVKGSSVDDDFSSIQREYGLWRLSLVPEHATWKNFRQWDDQVESFDMNDFDMWKSKNDEFLTRLGSIQYSDLSETIQVEYDILKDTLETFSAGYKWRWYSALNPISYTSGPQTYPELIVQRTPFLSKGDFVNYLTRLEQQPAMIMERIGLMRKAVELGHTHNEVSVSKTRLQAQFQRILTDTPDQFAMYKPFNETLAELETADEAFRTDIRTRARVAIAAILTSLRDLQTYMYEEYMNHLRPGLGVSYWDGGDDFYKDCLRWHLSLDMSPEEVHQIGLEEVDRIYNNMIKIMRRKGHRGTVKEFFDNMRLDSQFSTSNKTEILEIYKDIIYNQIEPTLTSMFHDKDLLGLPVIVSPSLTDGPFAYYVSGMDDGSTPATFFINLFRPTDLLIPDFVALSLHETNPGHHLQNTVEKNIDLPIYRKYADGSKYYQVPFRPPGYTAYSEGWALYSESLGEELNLYKDDYTLLGRYSAEQFRACRLVVDTGIHYYNWTKERAVEYMLNYTAFGRGMLEGEVDRYATWPGQACSYKIGEIKIRQLRTKAENVLGNRFDIKDFHSAVLGNGRMPLTTLEKIVDKWIDRTSQGQGRSDPCTSNSTALSGSIIAIIMSYISRCFLNSI